ncbi:putative serine/threonine-protein kinase PBL28 isoform X2 [Prunus yedoensis var. nudiflora]|uniref:non-specific serine/threonine protein kinase n=1 Tax=Prunus yedoensis var. nudiflora TaxID=2094558 RepID=A0A314Y1K0_PRUYE|nr:putative serine/threonine-protein kinase PBL28 isoform X2 [Prunus yedoensis var. nudiflora]
MRLFWWQQLPLLLLIQLLEPSRTGYKIYAEALQTFKSRVGGPQLFNGQIRRYPCIKQWKIVNCHKDRFSGIRSVPRRANTVNLSPFSPRLVVAHSSIQLQKELHKPRNRRIAAIVDGDNGAPTLTPVQEARGNNLRKQKVAALIGGVAAALLVAIIVVIVYICLMRVKRFIRRTSETESSVPSPPGQCRFGLVYKGLLQDGSIVAIKRRLHAPTQYFFHEVKRIARVNHMHVLRLIGYCQDASQQLLVYEYLPNGNVGNHLYDAEGLPIGKLGIRQRLSIALGAAKGLAHLHNLVPPLLHMYFRTSNVLLDENFTAKVSDYGLTKLLVKGHHAGSSSTIDYFLDPELDLSKKFSEKSDVYSFGVFLLELISGREANGRIQLSSGDNLILQAKGCNDLGRFVDKTFGDNSMQAAKQMMELALMCIAASQQRLQMQIVIEELERIHRASEISHFHVEVDEEIGAVTLGSELFK